MSGELAEARTFLPSPPGRFYEDLGNTVPRRAWVSLPLRATLELLAGDLRRRRARAHSLPAARPRDESARKYFLSTVSGLLGYALLQQGRIDAAIAATEAAEQMAAADDVESHSLWRRVRAAAVTALGAPDEALPLALTAYDLVADTDAPLMKAFALLDLGAAARCHRQPGRGQERVAGRA